VCRRDSVKDDGYAAHIPMSFPRTRESTLNLLSVGVG
jgi:hypothetical protein